MKKMMLWVVLMFLGLVILIGCGKEEPVSVQPTGTETTGSQTPIVSGQVTEHQITDAEIGQEVACPVMTDSKFKVKKNTPAVDYQGKTYYFCCGDCLPIFKKEPGKYSQPEHKEDAHKGQTH